MPPIDGTPLADLPGLPKATLDKLKASWITTAEQLVAATAALGGAKKMAGQLGVGLTEFQRMLEVAESAIPEGERQRLKSPVDNRNHGLGALPGEPPD